MSTQRLRVEIARLHELLDETEQRRREAEAESGRWRQLCTKVIADRDALHDRLDRVLLTEREESGKPVRAARNVK